MSEYVTVRRITNGYMVYIGKLVYFFKSLDEVLENLKINWVDRID